MILKNNFHETYMICGKYGGCGAARGGRGAARRGVSFSPIYPTLLECLSHAPATENVGNFRGFLNSCYVTIAVQKIEVYFYSSKTLTGQKPVFFGKYGTPRNR
jgi:hypothetical protein